MSSSLFLTGSEKGSRQGWRLCTEYLGSVARCQPIDALCSCEKEDDFCHVSVFFLEYATFHVDMFGERELHAHCVIIITLLQVLILQVTTYFIHPVHLCIYFTVYEQRRSEKR